jgi:hypothetical protein
MTRSAKTVMIFIIGLAWVVFACWLAIVIIAQLSGWWAFLGVPWAGFVHFLLRAIKRSDRRYRSAA